MNSLFWFVVAALGEIGGCYAFWGYAKLKWPWWTMVPGTAVLLVFAWALTRVDASHAGRAYAAYAAIYLCGALGWMWIVERAAPDRWDMTGAAVALVGCGIIFFAPRTA